MKHVVWLLSVLVFAGCAPKVPVPEETALLSVRLEGLAFEEPVFVTRTAKKVRFEFMQPMSQTEALTVAPGEICVQGYCMDAAAFNARFLRECMAPETLWAFVAGEPLPEGCAKESTDGAVRILSNEKESVMIRLEAMP